MNFAYFSLATNPGLTWYVNYKNFRAKSNGLGSLYLALDPIQDLEINIDILQHVVFIYSKDDIKKAAEINFKTYQEKDDFENLYDQYYDKRWNEIPTIKLSSSDWQEVQQKWEHIKQEWPQYVMFILDDSGELDKIDIIGKNELSQEDLDSMQHEHEKYLAWEKAIQLYNHDHEIIDDIWHSPADNMFDEDIQKYLGRETGFVQHKIYTKQDVIEELQAKLKRKEPVYMIIHWLYVRRAYGIENADEIFLELLQQFGFMDMEWEEMISEEKLQQIADRLSLGQDVNLNFED